MLIHVDRPKIELVTRADDAASAKSANRAIAETFTHGICRNVSVMAIGPELRHAHDELGSLDGLCVGCHLSLNGEWTSPLYRPVLDADRVPSLVDDRGFLLPRPQDLHERGFNVDELAAEAQAQLDRLRDVGFDVRYMDAHMGVTWLDGLADRVRALCEREGVLYHEDVAGALPSKLDEQPAATRQDAWVNVAIVTPPGRYVVVGHPAYDDEEMAAIVNIDHPPGTVAKQRDLERRAFLDPRWPDLCDMHGIQPVRYDEPSRLAPVS